MFSEAIGKKKLDPKKLERPVNKKPIDPMRRIIAQKKLLKRRDPVIFSRKIRSDEDSSETFFDILAKKNKVTENMGLAIPII